MRVHLIGPLNDISKGVIKKKLIEENLDDMLRVAGSLRLGKISASELIKTLLKSDKPSSLAKAIKEVGRINKTIYLLNFIDDPNYRRRILTQLNRGESRHSVARAICHGMLGEIRKRYKQGQENQLGALGLVTNALILWNTIYMEKAIKFLKKESVEIDDKDLERLSPLVFKHVNMLGHYSFDIQKQFSNGKLRPLGNVN